MRTIGPGRPRRIVERKSATAKGGASPPRSDEVSCTASADATLVQQGAEPAAVLDRTRLLQRRADDDPEQLAEAVLLCAGAVQELTVPESAHRTAVDRILSEFDIGSRDALRRMRGVLRAAMQLERLRGDS